MSIALVAARAGVSPATVSLVINNKPSISPATAHAVRQAMEDVGYVPVPRAQRRGRPHKRESAARLALVTTTPAPWLRSPVYLEVLHGIEGASRESNATVLFHSASGKGDDEFEILDGNVDGLLLLGGYSSPDKLGSLSRLPCVQLMGEPKIPGWCDHVTYNNEAIGLLAANHLLNRGHHHTGCILLQSAPIWKTRQRVFESTIAAAGGTVKSAVAANALRVDRDKSSIDVKVLSPLLDELLAASPQPTGLFLSADILASPIYWLLMEHGLRPMKDIEIITCNNDHPFLSGLHPQPAVIDIHASEVAALGVERLLWRMQRSAAPIVELLVQPELIVESG